jgi:hypothetical protein
LANSDGEPRKGKAQAVPLVGWMSNLIVDGGNRVEPIGQCLLMSFDTMHPRELVVVKLIVRRWQEFFPRRASPLQRHTLSFGKSSATGPLEQRG